MMHGLGVSSKQARSLLKTSDNLLYRALGERG
jgi:hypothetical protein